jgi:hypothetical protein
MTNSPFFSDATVIADVNAITALLASGFLEIWSGAQPADANQALTGTKLAKLALSATAFVNPAVASGSAPNRLVTATANAITTSGALATGTAGYMAFLKSDDTTVVAMGSVGTAGCDLNLNTTSLVSGVNVSVSAFTITQVE